MPLHAGLKLPEGKGTVLDYGLASYPFSSKSLDLSLRAGSPRGSNPGPVFCGYLALGLWASHSSAVVFSSRKPEYPKDHSWPPLPWSLSPGTCAVLGWGVVLGGGPLAFT